MSPQPQQPQQPPAPAPASPSPQPPSPEPAAINGADSEASSTASARVSPTDSAFVDDPGVGFDPEHPGAEPPPPPEPLAAEIEEPEWDEESIRRWLLVQGELTHSVIGLAPNEWRHTEADLKSIAGPLSRILNRYDQTRAIAAYNDPLSVTFGMSMYTIRSVQERRAMIAELRAAEEQAAPVQTPPGPAAPPAGVQPKPEDLDWEIPR